jgi:hypothetical protein
MAASLQITFNESAAQESAAFLERHPNCFKIIFRHRILPISTVSPLLTGPAATSRCQPVPVTGAEAIVTLSAMPFSALIFDHGIMMRRSVHIGHHQPIHVETGRPVFPY